MEIKQLSPEKLEKLKSLGLEVEVIYKTKCDLCGKKFESKDPDKVQKILEKHVDEKCKAVKWIRGATNILKIMGLENPVMGDLEYIQKGKFPGGYSRTKDNEIDILNRARELLGY